MAEERPEKRSTAQPSVVDPTLTATRHPQAPQARDFAPALGSAPDVQLEAPPSPPAPEAPAAAAAPDEFDGYRIVRLIGRGGMGEVFLAQDTALDRAVAIKFVSALQPGPSARERFLREARAIARLQHPNVVAVYRAGEVAGRRYLVSELVRGKSLDQVATPLPTEELLRVALGLAAGLAAAHRRGVLHRDLKPANALLSDDGEVKLCDFGLAKLVGLEPRLHAELVGAGDEAVALLSALTNPDLTLPGTLMGTPRYMAPEIWRGEAATVQSDLYSLGAILFQLSTGRAAFTAKDLHALRATVLAGPPPLLSEIGPQLDRRFCTLVDRCLASVPASRPVSADEVHAELVAVVAPAVVAPSGNPYRGLRAFEAEHRAVFFGRRSETLAVLELVRTEGLVVVAGDSGVGKSSLCRAGVLPMITDGGLHDDRTWTTVRLVPGRQPLIELARALASTIGMPDAELANRLREDPGDVARRLPRLLGDRRGMLLLVDQLEELVTESTDDERDLMALALAELSARIPGVRVLATARGDFLTRLAALPGLGRELSRSLYLLGPMDRAALREVVAGPARIAGLRFESEALVDELVSAAGETPAALPLLQFALAELWERRDVARAMITSEAQANIGGVGGALASHADGVLATMSPLERKAARRVLTQLVTLAGTRSYRGESELAGDDVVALAALRGLVRGRLLAVQGDDDGSSVYAVAHEALLTGWATLRSWLDRDLERRGVHERLATAAAEWDRLERSRTTLWGQPQLVEAARVELVPSLLAGRERTFLDASMREARRRTWRRRGLVIAAPVLILALWGGLTLKALIDRNRVVAAQLALAKPQLEVAARHAADSVSLRTEAFASFDAGRDDEGEEIWSRARHSYANAEAAYSQATRPLETALKLDINRADVRVQITESLYARAILAEQFHERPRVTELLERLEWHDTGGEWMARWMAPASLALQTTPAGARVQVTRYEEQGGRRVLGTPMVTGATPLEIQLVPGSYLLVIESAGRPPVRYPVLLERAEHLPITIDVPPSVPDRYVYVPPGRFLYDSADQDKVRRAIFMAGPQRAVTLPGYLIGRYEVTWNEWLQFLAERPNGEQRKHLPRADGVTLLEGANGAPVIRLRPSSIEFEAKVGEPIVYPDREHRRRQDWQLMPVTGITRDDASTFMDWLDDTDRLPGARFCTDREWERAARGADDRIYPHGDVLAPDDANFDRTYGQRSGAFGPDEVGSHPASDSPFGLSDMSGNAWEFVRSGTDWNTIYIRGGGFYEDPLSQQSTNRFVTEPGLRERGIGIRVCADY